jgi:hypothetical protein
MRSQSELIRQSHHVIPSHHWWARLFIPPQRYHFDSQLLSRINHSIREYVDDKGQVKYPQPFFSSLQMMINDCVRFDRCDDTKIIIFLYQLQADLFVTLIKQRLQSQSLPSIFSAMDQALLSLHYQSVIESHCLARVTQLTESQLPNVTDFPKRLRCCLMAYGGPTLAPLVEKMLQTERHERVIIPFPIQKAS